MPSTLAEPSVSRGKQEPRVCHVPRATASTGKEAVELCDAAGLTLDPWQNFVLEESLGERDGKWAAKEVGLVCPRQNGKNEILLARQLVGLFLLDEKLIIHSAHQFDTSVEAFLRLIGVLEDNPELMARVATVAKSHGSEGITLKDGRRIRFRTRTGGGGRGFTIDCFMFDESMILPESFHGTLVPTLLARPNTQIWYTGSAVDQEIHEHGVVLARVRERGIAGDDDKLAYFEWSLDCENPERVPDELLMNAESHAEANPGFGTRLLPDSIDLARRSMDRRSFAVECLGVGDWPRTDGLGDKAITPAAWAACTDLTSKSNDPVCFAFDVTPDRSRACIAAAGFRADGKIHVEVVEHKRKTEWVAEEVERLMKAHEGSVVVCDASGLTSSLLPDLLKLRIEPLLMNATEHGQACGMIFDAVEQGILAHLGTPELADAIACSVKRPLGDAWAWSRKDATGDISPLVASTLAVWGLQTQTKPEAQMFI